MLHPRELALLVLTLASCGAARAEGALEESPHATLATWIAIPADEELEARGARIGAIEIRINDVFDTSAPLSAPYRLANGLHIATRPGAVRAQMLFDAGDRFSRQALEETARVLRASPYLGEASVEAVRYDEAENTVDVIVRVRDVWTLSPGFSFGRKGGRNSTRLRFKDANLLGLGKEIEMSRSQDANRSGWRFAYADPNVLGSHWSMASAYGSLSDGSEKLFEIGQPFYSLDSRAAFAARWVDASTVGSRYALGEIVDQFDMREQRVELSGGRSSGLQNGWVRRLVAGVRRENRHFSALRSHESVRLPDDRVLTYPWIGVEWIEDEYVETWNLDQIGRTEDLNLGSAVRLEAGFASSVFGSTRESIVLNGQFRTGARLAEDEYLISTLDYAGRLEQGTLHDGRLDVTSRYYLRQSPRRLLFAAATASFTEKLDLEDQLLLGGDNGLRGYPFHYQGGATCALITLEERVHTNWRPLGLFNVGAAVFFDAGRTWGRDEFAGRSLGWLKDVGVGLRLGAARSGLGNVLHIDLAFPLDGGRELDSVQLLVETRRSF
jgi:hypothetical protein